MTASIQETLAPIQLRPAFPHVLAQEQPLDMAPPAPIEHVRKNTARLAARVGTIAVITGAFLARAGQAYAEVRHGISLGPHMSSDITQHALNTLQENPLFAGSDSEPWPVPDTEHTGIVHLNPPDMPTPSSIIHEYNERRERTTHNGHLGGVVLAALGVGGIVVATAGYMIRKSYYELRRGPVREISRPATNLTGFAPGDEPPTGLYADEETLRAAEKL